MSESASTSNATRLLPVFIKMEYASVLILGAEKKGIEIVKQILHDLPDATAVLADRAIDPELKRDLDFFARLIIVESSYHQTLLDHTDMVIVNVDDTALIASVCEDARQRGIWVHVVDRPELSDVLFNSGFIEREIVNVGNSGYSPANLKTSGITPKPGSHGEIRWRRIATWSLFAFFFMFIGHLIISFLPLPDMIATIKEGMQQLDRQFYWMIVAGFVAQMVDGMLGMGYGVVSITILMSLGLNLPAISGSIHTAEMFSSGASGYTHYKFGNVNKKLFKTLLIPGVIGAVLGAVLLSTYGEKYATYFRPLIAGYTLLLGVRILIISFRKRT
ncbi:MAG: TSUP family transporter, partial [Chitinophagaceae bacterium]|nr:TSUP family transporter [Chitinophagaceae bacterium]